MNMKKCAYFLMASFLFLSSCSTGNDGEDSESPNNGWSTLSKDEIEQKLKDNSGKDNADVDAIVSSLESNENVDEVYATADNMQVVVKTKTDDSYAVYPIHLPKDIFNESTDTRAGQSSRYKDSRFNYDYQTTGANGIVAVFNYFSNSYYGNDNYGSRVTQNLLLDHMCRELNYNDYGVEFYGYEQMTLKNLLKVKANKTKYKAVIIISHGFADEKQSYFLIGEEYDYAIAHNDQFLKDEGFELPLKYKFWNEGLFGFKERYDFAVPVNKMDFGDNVLLYMGPCDAYRYDSDMKGNCIGWNGTNSTAQAHVALLFHKLLRGKNLYDALDIYDNMYTYYSTTAAQTDTWRKDLVYDNTILKCSMDKQTGLGGGIAKKQWAQGPNYYKNGSVIPKIRVYDASGKITEGSASNFITMGICKMKDHKFKLYFSCVDDLPSDYVYIKATPLRADAEPVIHKIKKEKLQKGVKMELETNGVWDISAALDRNFNVELLLYKPVAFVYAKPFKDNSISIGDVDDVLSFNVGEESFDMVIVEGGSFMMGAEDDDEEKYYSDEKPRHQVTLNSFAIGDTEVTQALWKAVTGNNPSYYRGDELPVERVSWDDCQVFVKKLNQLTGRTFRLPTEAEWEYAARGGKKGKGYRFAGSNNVDEIAWTYENCNNTTHTVATKAPNELGLYDMSGNVYEWCQDWYAWDYYKYSPTNNPCNTTEPSADDAINHQHIHRGGCIDVIIKDLRNAMRGDFLNEPTVDYRGLRLALTL